MVPSTPPTPPTTSHVTSARQDPAVSAAASSFQPACTLARLPLACARVSCRVCAERRRAAPQIVASPVRGGKIGTVVQQPPRARKPKPKRCGGGYGGRVQTTSPVVATPKAILRAKRSKERAPPNAAW